jgi:hypothetical protein
MMVEVRLADAEPGRRRGGKRREPVLEREYGRVAKQRRFYARPPAGVKETAAGRLSP